MGLLARLIAFRRSEHGFLLTAWVLLPDHWHAIIYPRYPLTISEVLETIKVSATRRINRGRQTAGPLFQSRFFDRALRTVKEYGDTVEYIHGNPVRRGYATHPQEWKWSSAKEYAGVGAAEFEMHKLCATCLHLNEIVLWFNNRDAFNFMDKAPSKCF